MARAKILVIEDDWGVMDALRNLLTMQGYDVLLADSATLGIHVALTNPPDIVICDIAMPSVDGYQVLERLRKEPSTSYLPFIFISALNGEDAIQRGLEMGAVDYILKPFNIERVLSVIQAYLPPPQAQGENFPDGGPFKADGW
jgi:DNA-binding response OmpR family regulator